MSAAQEGLDFTARDMDSCFLPLVRKTDDVFSGIDSFHSGVDALTQESLPSAVTWILLTAQQQIHCALLCPFL